MFLAAGVVTIIAIPPGLALGGRTRRLTAERTADGAVAAGGTGAGGTSALDGEDGFDPTVAL
jgi:hypothetical protein